MGYPTVSVSLQQQDGVSHCLSVSTTTRWGIPLSQCLFLQQQDGVSHCLSVSFYNNKMGYRTVSVSLSTTTRWGIALSQCLYNNTMRYPTVSVSLSTTTRWSIALSQCLYNNKMGYRTVSVSLQQQGRVLHWQRCREKWRLRRKCSIIHCTGHK